MKFMLDSNIVISAALGVGEPLHRRMAACDADDMVTSAIVYAEVVLGSMRGKPPLLDRLRLLIEEVPVLDFDLSAATAYAAIPFRRGSYDQLIAAHALSRGLTIVTDNAAQFHNIPGLAVENWLLP